MNFVEPIRDLEKLENMCSYLEETNPRNNVLFSMGIYTGLRVGDILKLRIKDVHDKRFITLKESKTGKTKPIEINPVLKRILKEYTKDKNQNEFLIKSREQANKAISRVMAYKIIRKVGEMFGIDNLGTHTMRKTFGYHYYKRTHDVVTLQKLFNHSSATITLRYIGIEQDDLNKAYRNIKYF
ncbi:site-specific integrase [Clostridioides difficile]|nr:site-specific integrase [Clostridioides difficile]